MLRQRFIPVVLFILLTAAGLFAQASQYPELARKLAHDGFAGRQSGYIARIGKASMEQNRLGFAAYQKRNWEEAIRLFRRAIELDKTNMFAHFNLACTLSLAYGNDPKTAAEIVKHLEAASRQDVHWTYKAFLDQDLAAVREALVKFNIFLPDPGDCGMDEDYSFRPDGTVNYSASIPDVEGMGPDGKGMGFGMGDGPGPDSGLSGWYMIIGDCFLIYIPGQNKLLSESGIYPPDDVPPDYLHVVPFIRDKSGRIVEIERMY